MKRKHKNVPNDEMLLEHFSAISGEMFRISLKQLDKYIS